MTLSSVIGASSHANDLMTTFGHVTSSEGEDAYGTGLLGADT